MKINLTLILSLIILSSCNYIHLHNIKNDFRWRNKKLSENLDITLLFNPLIIKDFGFNSELKYFFEKPNKINGIEGVLKDKLSKRNFVINNFDLMNSIVIDSIIFYDKVGMESVYHDDEFLGSFEKHNIGIKVLGHLNIKGGDVTKISSEYDFVREPREGYIIKGFITHTNAGVNLDKIMNNVLNLSLIHI